VLHLLTRKMRADRRHGRAVHHILALDGDLLIQAQASGVHLRKYGGGHRRLEHAHHGVGPLGMDTDARMRGQIHNGNAQHAGCSAIGQLRQRLLQTVIRRLRGHRRRK
jgi:hypothetical protein